MVVVNGIRVQGRWLSDADLDQIRRLRQEHPEWSRTQWSVHLAEQWQWRNEAGRLKDMAARTMLLKLQALGLITLPASRRRKGNGPKAAKAPGLVQPELLPGAPAPAPIGGPLRSLQPVTLELVTTTPRRRYVTELLRQHHYQGYSGPVGQNVQYIIRDARGRELAVMVFSAAAWKVAPRDQFIGWSAEQRQHSLSRVTNQQRFLILPWVRVPQLASHLLALALARLSTDWQARYGHPVWLVETFVQDERFTGTAYRAAGWQCVGQTTGRTRQDRHNTMRTPIKSIWLKPLHPQFQKHLTTLRESPMVAASI